VQYNRELGRDRLRMICRDASVQRFFEKYGFNVFKKGMEGLILEKYIGYRY
jgi:hypothetical protein